MFTNIPRISNKISYILIYIQQDANLHILFISRKATEFSLVLDNKCLY